MPPFKVLKLLDTRYELQFVVAAPEETTEPEAEDARTEKDMHGRDYDHHWHMAHSADDSVRMDAVPHKPWRGITKAHEDEVQRAGAGTNFWWDEVTQEWCA